MSRLNSRLSSGLDSRLYTRLHGSGVLAPVPAPVLVSVSMEFGSSAGDTFARSLVVTGLVDSVTVGGTACTGVTQPGGADTPALVAAGGWPAKALGQHDILVSGPGGASNTLVNGYTSFFAPFMSIVSSSTVTQSPTTVSQLADQSGNGNHASQVSGALQPSYSASWSNGKPSLLFATSQKYLKSAAFAAPLAGPNTIITVLDTPAAGFGGARIAVDSINAGNRQTMAAEPTSGGQLEMYAGAAIVATTGVNSPLIFTGRFDTGTSASTLRKNGTQIMTGATGSQSMSGVTIGDRAQADGSFSWRGNIGGVFVFGSLLTNANCLMIERFFGGYHGIVTA